MSSLTRDQKIALFGILLPSTIAIIGILATVFADEIRAWFISAEVSGSSQTLKPKSVWASDVGNPSQDAAYQTITYEAERAVDGRLDTAWLVEGSGINEYIHLDFGTPVRISSIQLVPGYAKVDPRDHTNRFFQMRRVLRVRFEFSDGSGKEEAFEEKPELQSSTFKPIVSTFVRIVILETTSAPSDPVFDRTPISEIVVIGKTQ